MLIAGGLVPIVMLFLNGLVMVALPILVAVAVRRATKARWILLVGGALAFIGSQVVHLPLLWGWSALVRADVLPVPGTVAQAILLGALAGLCEEPARALLFWRVRERGRDAALFAGAGHGGVEAMILGAMVLLGAVNIAFMSEMTAEDLVALGSPADAAATAVEQVQAALATPWYETIAGAFERAITIPFHMACSLLVMASFRRKSILPFLVAVLLHAGVDTAAALLAGLHQGTWATELELAAFAVPVTIGVWVWAFRTEPRESPPSEAPVAP